MAALMADTGFVSHRQEKFHFPDGRRGVRFYLVDESGNATPAVLGEERDTRDGHYMYRKETGFSDGASGERSICGNLAGVHKWLREMMSQTASYPAPSQGAVASVSGGTAAADQEEHRNPAKRMKTDSAGTAGSGGSGGGGAASHKQGGGSAAAGGVGGGHGGATSAAALAHAAAEAARLQRLGRRVSALAYVRESPLDDAKAEVAECCATLAECVALQKELGKPLGFDHPRYNPTLESLRRLQAVYCNLPLLEATKAGELVTALSRGPDKLIAQMASSVVQQWLGALLANVETLAERPDPDPAPEAVKRVSHAAGAGSHAKAAVGPSHARRDGVTGGGPSSPGGLRSTARVRTGGRHGAPASEASGEDASAGAGADGGRQTRRGQTPTADQGKRSGDRRVMIKVPENTKKPPKIPSRAGTQIVNKTRSGKVVKEEEVPVPKPKPEKSKPLHPPAPIGSSPLAKKHLKKGEIPTKTPLGKGRKLCHVCGTVVGSPTRVCPHCHANLPFKTHN